MAIRVSHMERVLSRLLRAECPDKGELCPSLCLVLGSGALLWPGTGRGPLTPDGQPRSHLFQWVSTRVSQFSLGIALHKQSFFSVWVRQVPWIFHLLEWPLKLESVCLSFFSWVSKKGLSEDSSPKGVSAKQLKQEP